LIRFEVFPRIPGELTQKVFDDNQALYLKKLEEYMKLNTSDIIFNKLWIGEAINDCFANTNDKALEKITNLFQTDYYGTK
jgi:hypothetical protein